MKKYTLIFLRVFYALASAAHVIRVDSTSNWKATYHQFHLNITAKVSSFINVNVGTIVLYDYDQDNEAQLSQLLNIRLAYSFQNFEEKK